MSAATVSAATVGARPLSEPYTHVELVHHLFDHYGIRDLPPNRVHEAIRERFTQADLDAYHEALTTLYEQGVLG